MFAFRSVCAMAIGSAAFLSPGLCAADGPYRTPHTDQLHVMERFRLIDGGKGLEDLITVNDPGTFTRPWSAVQRFRLTQRKLVENIFVENNHGFFDYGLAPLPQATKSGF